MKKLPISSFTLLALISLPAGSSQAADLLGYYDFDDNSDPLVAPATDGIAPDAAITAPAAFTADMGGRSGLAGDYALDLGAGAGSGAFARVPAGPHLDLAATTNSMAVSFWQFNVGDGGGGFFSTSSFWVDSPTADGGQRGFQVHAPWGNGIFYFDQSGCCVTPGQRLTTDGVITAGVWQHIVVQRDDLGNQEIWVDGTMAAEATGAEQLDPFSGIVTIGANGGGTNNLTGSIDEFAIYVGTLSETDIGQLAAGTAIPTDIATAPEDADNDGLPDFWEVAFGLDPSDDGSVDPNNGPDGDPDMDGLTNLGEFDAGLEPNNDDYDMDTLLDGVETNTGVYVDATDTGTDPKNADTDGDTLLDSVETGTGTFVDAMNTGTDPNKDDTDGDLVRDHIEIEEGFDPNDPDSTPTVAVITLLDGLLGGDLTDPEDDGVDGETVAGPPQTAGSNFNWISITANTEEYFGDFGGSEGSFDVFDNQTGGGQNKLCCGGEPVDITVQFEVAVSLTHLTLTSSNDTPGRDPLDFEIQGSNDGIVFETIYSRSGDVSIWGATRNLTARIDLPAPSDSYTFIRYAVTRTGIGVHAISEIEYFGEVGPVIPPEIVSTEFDPATNKMTLTWNSREGKTYSVFTSTDLIAFLEDIDDSVPSGGDFTSLSFTLFEPIDVRRYYRVMENE